MCNKLSAAALVRSLLLAATGKLMQGRTGAAAVFRQSPFRNLTMRGYRLAR